MTTNLNPNNVKKHQNDLSILPKKMAFFKDNIRTVDYVIVISRISARKNYKLISIYLNNLIKNGLDIEQSMGVTEPVIYIKLHMPLETYNHCRLKYTRWENILGGKYHPPAAFSVYKCLRTPLDYMDHYMDGYDYTGHIYYIAKMLTDCKFGRKVDEHGVGPLITSKVVLKAYPMHSGGIMDFNTPLDQMNDRTKLMKYWGSFRCIYKTQPLDLIKKYFGVEVGLFFAWNEFYIKMLVIAVIGSIVVNIATLYNFISFKFSGQLETLCSQEDKYMCGYCLEDDQCHMEEIKPYCFFYELSVLIDIDTNHYFALFMSAWTGCVLLLWKRRFSTLMRNWNLDQGELYVDERYQFKEVVKYRRKSKITGKLEVYLINSTIYLKVIFMFLIFLLVQTVIISILFLNVSLIVYAQVQWAIYTNNHNVLGFDFLLLFTQTIFTNLCFRLLNVIVKKMVRFATIKYVDVHNHVFLLLRYFFACTNQFGMFLYMSFLKGQLYNIPFTKDPWFFQYDTCQPIKCSVHIVFILTIRSLFIALESIITVINTKRKERKAKNTYEKMTHIPQHEIESKMLVLGHYRIHLEFIRAMIMHGFIACFAINNSLGPVITIITILIRVRLEAYNFSRRYQRTVPKIRYNTNSWNMILMFVTVVSIVINSMGIIFTSEATERKAYYEKHGSYSGYFNTTLSIFSISDFYHGSVPENEFCYYRSKRYPAGHKKQYKFTDLYYERLYYSGRFVVIFFHVVLGFLMFINVVHFNFDLRKGRIVKRKRTLR